MIFMKPPRITVNIFKYLQPLYNIAQNAYTVYYNNDQCNKAHNTKLMGDNLEHNE